MSVLLCLSFCVLYCIYQLSFISLFSTFTNTLIYTNTLIHPTLTRTPTLRSLATDVCALWLGGLNDSNTPPQFTCKRVECPYTYMPKPEGTDFNRTASILGPFSDNTDSVIENGMCLTDSDFFSEADVKSLGDCVSYIFDQNVQGQFLWNFRNELEPRWSYVEAFDRGWLNQYAKK